MSAVECPDCDGTWEVHAHECPIWQAMEKQKQDDRQFFERHPQVEVRRRKPIVEELLTALIVGGVEIPELPDGQRWHARGYVLVYRTDSLNVRVRRYSNAYLVADPNAPVTHWAKPKLDVSSQIAVLPDRWAEAIFGRTRYRLQRPFEDHFRFLSKPMGRERPSKEVRGRQDE
jgi:hypothetical protein